MSGFLQRCRQIVVASASLAAQSVTLAKVSRAGATLGKVITGAGAGADPTWETPAAASIAAGDITDAGAAGVSLVQTATMAAARAALDAQQDVFTTRGDLVRAGVAGAAERFAAVTAGNVVAGDGTDVVSQPIATTLVVAPAANLAALSLGLADTGSAVHRWPLTEGTGTSFADSGSAAQALTLTGSAARVTAPGIRGSGIYFDGTAGNYLRTIDSPTTPSAQSFTLHGWVKLAGYGGTYQLFANKLVDPTTWAPPYVGVGLGLGNSGSGIWYFHHSAGGTFVSTTVADDQYQLRLRIWQHLAVTYDGANVRAYLDGVLAASVAATGDVTWGTGPWQLGGEANSGGSWLFGTLSDWRVEGSALTAAQLAAIYERGVRTLV